MVANVTNNLAVGSTNGGYTITGFFKEGELTFVHTKCTCGATPDMAVYTFTKYRFSSCVCHILLSPRAKTPEVTEGTVFGKLTVLQIFLGLTGYKAPQRVPFCLCHCACGKIKICNYYNLLNGRSSTCGCGCVRKQQENLKSALGYALPCVPGDRIGDFTLLKNLTPNETTRRKEYWLFSCSCGREKKTFLGTLLSFKSTRCTCSKYLGQSFGTLFVEDSTIIDGNQYFICQCSCGVRKTVRSSSLISGRTLTCGSRENHPDIRKGVGAYKYIPGAQVNNRVLIRKLKASNAVYESIWQVRCSCGGILNRTLRSVLKTKFCLCDAEKYIGQSFGDLCLISLDGVDANCKGTFLCSCGRKVRRNLQKVIEQKLTHCGCKN